MIPQELIETYTGEELLFRLRLLRAQIDEGLPTDPSAVTYADIIRLVGEKEQIEKELLKRAREK